MLAQESEEHICPIVDVMPVYPEGQKAMEKFIQDHIRYPQQAVEAGENGIVYVGFVVNTDGSHEQIKIIKGVSKTLDTEAIRVVGLMKKWKPGVRNNEIVRSRLVVPVRFEVQDKKQSLPPPPSSNTPVDKAEWNKVSDKIYNAVKVGPQFPGGEAAMAKFMIDNFRYPEVDKEMGLQGTVYIRFVVNENGSLSNIEVMRGVSKTIDAEGVRVIKAMPKWIPAEENGRPVSASYTVPFICRLR